MRILLTVYNPLYDIYGFVRVGASTTLHGGVTTSVEAESFRLFPSSSISSMSIYPPSIQFEVMIIAVASMLANSDYAFLEPTLGDHATANKVRPRPRPRLRLRLGLRRRLGLARALALAVTLTLTLTLTSNPDKVATTPDSIGMLFSIASVTYTLSCPLTGILAKRSRLGPRRVIVTGLVLQLVGFLLIGERTCTTIGLRTLLS